MVSTIDIQVSITSIVICSGHYNDIQLVKVRLARIFGKESFDPWSNSVDKMGVLMANVEEQLIGNVWTTEDKDI